MATSNGTTRNLIIFGIIALAVIIAIAALTAPDRRTTGERISDAAEALPNGIDNAARELEDRTPGEKIGDAVKDAGNEIKENTR